MVIDKKFALFYYKLDFLHYFVHFNYYIIYCVYLFIIFKMILLDDKFIFFYFNVFITMLISTLNYLCYFYDLNYIN